MVGINKELLKQFVTEGFFDNPQPVREVVNQLDSYGYTLKGKQVSRLSQLLAYLCRERILRRERDAEGGWRYIKHG